MTIKLLCIGKTDSKELQNLIEVYLKRLQFYTKFEIDVIPDLKKAKNLDENQQKSKEGELILNKVQTSDYLVLLDENGKQFSSEAFSEYLQKRMNSGLKQLIFVIVSPNWFFSFKTEGCSGRKLKVNLQLQSKEKFSLKRPFKSEFLRTNCILHCK